MNKPDASFPFAAAFATQAVDARTVAALSPDRWHTLPSLSLAQSDGCEVGDVAQD